MVSTNYRPAASLTSSLQAISHPSNSGGVSSANGGNPGESGSENDGRAGSVDSTACGQRDSPKRCGSMPGFSPSSSNSCSNSCCFMEMKDGQLSLYTEPILVHSPHLPQSLHQAHPLDSSSAGLGYSGPPSYVSSAPSSPLFATSSSTAAEFDITRPLLSGQIVGSVTNLYQDPVSTDSNPTTSSATTTDTASAMDKAFSFGWEDL